jgi:murein DD-endopeptidase MepM/ murein hydrolase activator NlpD
MKSLLTKLLIKYRVVVFKKESLEKLHTFNINKIHIILLILLIFWLSLFFSSLLLIFSPLGNNFFDYSKKQEISELYLHVDSIENLLNLHLNYTENLKLLFHEQDTLKNNSINEVVFSLPFLQSKITKQDSSLINYIKKLDQASVTKYNSRVLSKLNITSPTKGFVTSSFNIKEGHFGVDIAAEKNTSVFSILNGVVLFSGYSGDFGNFLVVGHENSFISIYLHNSTLLKNTGDFVKTGEKIALIGSSGNLSSAPHLHFELWSGVTPIDPEKYLQFK